MTRAEKALVIGVVAVFGLWGCAQEGGKPSGGSSERLKALESKCTKLETDCHKVAEARDAALQKLARIDQERAQDARTQQEIAKERDALKEQMTSRTAERDSAKSQLEELRKGIRTLLGTAEAAAPSPGKAEASEPTH